MQTENIYEEMALKELRNIPINSQPYVIKILRSLRGSIAAESISHKKLAKGSELCGIWKDNRSAEEIISDIQSHRTGFGGREVDI